MISVVVHSNKKFIYCSKIEFTIKDDTHEFVCHKMIYDMHKFNVLNIKN